MMYDNALKHLETLLNKRNTIKNRYMEYLNCTIHDLTIGIKMNDERKEQISKCDKLLQLIEKDIDDIMESCLLNREETNNEPIK